MSCNCCPTTPLLPRCAQYSGVCATSIVSSAASVESDDFYSVNVLDTAWTVNLNLDGFLNGSYILEPSTGHHGFILGANSYAFLQSPTFCPTPNNTPGPGISDSIIGTVNASDMKAVCSWNGGGFNCNPSFVYPFGFGNSGSFAAFSPTLGSWSVLSAEIQISSRPIIFISTPFSFARVGHPEIACYEGHPYSTGACKDIYLSLSCAIHHNVYPYITYSGYWAACYGTYLLNNYAPDSLTLFQVTQPYYQGKYTFPEPSSASITKLKDDFNSLPDTITITRA